MKATTKQENSSNSSAVKEQENTTERNGTKPAQQPFLETFFGNMLKDIYWAEQHLLSHLQEIKDAATTEALQEALEEHRLDTQRHISRLERAFRSTGQEPSGKKCEAMEGLVKEAKSIIAETREGSMTRDAALIIAVQKIAHYKIASYGGMVQLALTMGLPKAADLLDDTLIEEEEYDRALTGIAEGFINVEADRETHYSWASSEKQEAASA